MCHHPARLLVRTVLQPSALHSPLPVAPLAPLKPPLMVTSLYSVCEMLHDEMLKCMQMSACSQFQWRQTAFAVTGPQPKQPDRASAGQGFGLQASNPPGGSAGSVSGTGGTTSTGQFVIQTCSTKPAVLLAGSAPSSSATGAVAATPGAEAAATAG